MAGSEACMAPIAGLLDRIVADPAQRDAAKLALIAQQGAPEVQALQARLAAPAAGAPAADRWTSRARPSLLYVMDAMILWALPMGLIGALRPAAAAAMVQAMAAYLNVIPQPLYQLFGTGYLGYTAARQWGKVAGSDK